MTHFTNGKTSLDNLILSGFSRAGTIHSDKLCIGNAVAKDEWM